MNITTTGHSKALCLCVAHSYYDIGVALVDCVIVIVYTLHVWGPFELFYSTLGYQEKAIVTTWNLMVESLAPCLHTDP